MVQYTEMFKRKRDENDSGDDDRTTSQTFTYATDIFERPYGNGSSTSDTLSSPFDDSSDDPFSSSSMPGFHKDFLNGHGTWTSSIGAGAISAGSDVAPASCSADELPGCAGGCVKASGVDEMLDNGTFDLDLFCPMYECDGDAGLAYSYCLGNDPVETLYQNAGVAPGGQISMFDASYTNIPLANFAGNLLWESAMNTGAKIHSNSWGFTTFCQESELEFLYDTFMYEVRRP